MTDNPKSASYYDKHVEEISQQYLSVKFEDVHASWSSLLQTLFEKSSPSVLDVGAATGRDISYLYQLAISCCEDSKMHGEFIAVEPSNSLLKVGQKYTKQQSITWINDSLPELNQTRRLRKDFDLILLSAVWMHVPFSQRAQALENLSSLLKCDGFIVLSLKQGMTKVEQDKRAMYEVSVSEVELLCEQVGFICEPITEASVDALNRKGIHWETLVLRKSKSED